MDAAQLRQTYMRVLMHQIENAQHPSVPMMNRVEAELEDEDEILEYAEVLLKKIVSTPYPSVDLLDRVEALLARVS